MRRFGLGIAAAVITGLSTPVSAQSLEETYSNLCSDDTMKKNETCAALREAMLKKLTAERGQVTIGDLTTASAKIVPQQGYLPTAADIEAWSFIGRRASLGGLTFHNKELSNGTFALDEWVDATTIRNRIWSLEDGKLLISTIMKLDPLTKMVATQIEYPTEIGGTSLPVPAPWKVDEGVRESSHGIIQESRWRVNGKDHMQRQTVSQNSLMIEGFEIEGGIERPLGEPGIQEARAATLEEAMQEFAVAKAAKLQAEQQARAAAAQQKAARRASNGGLLRSLIGAGVGLMAGAAHGLDSSETLGAVMKGIEVTNPGSPLASALGAQGEQLLAGGNSAMPASPSGAFSAAATYPTQDNLAAGACSGFTESNYRQMAVQGGGDSQLHTMCGQAFEYYAMYKRAIAQGASQADAERTYKAHRQAAQTASGYLSSHGAN